MTTKELRKELITFVSEDYCNLYCKFIRIGFLINYSSNRHISNSYICNISKEDIELKNKGRSKIYRCQQCKDLFKDR